jgi:CRP/FNR family cyclic AMP-dependent transcriptional regulator
MALVGELWKGLTPEECEQAARLCPERRFPKGATIFAPGDPSDALYVLTSGLVTLSHVSEDGQESILRVLGPGDAFGEFFLAVRIRPFLAKTLTPCTVTVAPAEGFLHLLSTIPKIALNFICVLSRNLADMAIDRGQSSHKWSHQRLAITLLKLSAAHGVQDGDGRVIDLPLTHQILADMIGASRETVTRHLGRLKRQGVVSQKGRTLVVRPAGLQALIPKWAPSQDEPLA